jgi:uncharacterized protein
VIDVELKLSKKPKNPIVIEGFPGFGLVGTIASEFLISHLKCEKIGSYFFEDLPATVAIHSGKLIDPITISYNKKYNIVIVHSISGASGIEWKAADAVLDVCKQLNAKQLISLEGVGSAGEQEKVKDPKAFYHTNDSITAKKLDKLGVMNLQEGIIMGVTSAIILKTHIPTTSLFAETESNLPDSKAAAKIVEVLDKLLGLEVDYKPLIKQAEKFEEKLKSLIEQGSKAQQLKEKKAMNYVG